MKKKKEDVVRPAPRRQDGIDDEPREAWTSEEAPRKEREVSSLQVDLEKEDGCEDETRHTWTLISKLMMIGKY